MTKIMLVEDDKSLREIYGVRLLAEGYDIVSAGDGEEALAMAIKERPQLIISDVMMPKVSGYDMLDILRSTTETRNIHVIMMTALSSDEQRTRAESLGADRYLVKSQVGIEDVVRVVHEVLGDTPETAGLLPSPVAPTLAPLSPAPSAQPAPTTTVQQPASPQAPTPQAASATPQAPPVPAAAPQVIPSGPILKPATAPPRPAVFGQQAPKPASLKNRTIQPINDPNTSPVNINELLDKELAKEAGITDDARPVVSSAEQERAALEEQLRAFSANAPEPTPVTPLDETPSPAPNATPSTDASMTMPTTTPTSEPTVTNPVAPPPPPAPAVPLAPVTPASTQAPTTLPTPGIITPQPLPSVPTVSPRDVPPVN